MKFFTRSAAPMIDYTVDSLSEFMSQLVACGVTERNIKCHVKMWLET